jgi:hypothetical protein
VWVFLCTGLGSRQFVDILAVRPRIERMRVAGNCRSRQARTDRLAKDSRHEGGHRKLDLYHFPLLLCRRQREIAKMITHIMMP